MEYTYPIYKRSTKTKGLVVKFSDRVTGEVVKSGSSLRKLGYTARNWIAIDSEVWEDTDFKEKSIFKYYIK